MEQATLLARAEATLQAKRDAVGSIRLRTSAKDNAVMAASDNAGIARAINELRQSLGRAPDWSAPAAAPGVWEFGFLVVAKSAAAIETWDAASDAAEQEINQLRAEIPG